MPRLYDFELSGNCHKIRLLLALLGVEYERIDIDIRSGGSQSPEFLAINPRGQVPVYADGDAVIWDSMAILAYLARRYGDAHWLPTEPLALARVMQWLAVSENEILYGLARARAVLKMGRPFDLDAAQAMGRSALDVLEQRLATEHWLAGGDMPSIADIACFPYVALAPQGGLPLDTYPAVRAWIGRVQALPGYVGMPGIEAY
ncbi:glutathione S-transferase [Acidihalobacter ferrooxydans]|uniref:Glutathione S-transferase n=1 Tax=Acidihalobacter ferrooxydans TaxID=1765967 RepID=A0A1P8ULK5_9GAMM|nr:glutathione S-transferase [Acidihalobacter ferrooxydans]